MMFLNWQRKVILEKFHVSFTCACCLLLDKHWSLHLAEISDTTEQYCTNRRNFRWDCQKLSIVFFIEAKHVLYSNRVVLFLKNGNFIWNLMILLILSYSLNKPERVQPIKSRMEKHWKLLLSWYNEFEIHFASVVGTRYM